MEKMDQISANKNIEWNKDNSDGVANTNSITLRVS